MRVAEKGSADLFLPGSCTGCSLCQLACGLQEMLCLARLQVCLGALLLGLHRSFLGGLPCALGFLHNSEQWIDDASDTDRS